MVYYKCADYVSIVTIYEEGKPHSSESSGPFVVRRIIEARNQL